MVQTCELRRSGINHFPPVNQSAYQRFVFGYHGCEASVADHAILSGKHLVPSENDYDWLGEGIYFWEHGPERAMEWAQEKERRGEINQPAVVGALIRLGNCFDLLDIRSTSILHEAFEVFQNGLLADGQQIPENSGGLDSLKRKRDCAVLNFLMKNFEKAGTLYPTVRGVFTEGPWAFEGSGIRLKSHIQIAVRDPSCVLGYFRPASSS